MPGPNATFTFLQNLIGYGLNGYDAVLARDPLPLGGSSRTLPIPPRNIAAPFWVSPHLPVRLASIYGFTGTRTVNLDLFFGIRPLEARTCMEGVIYAAHRVLSQMEKPGPFNRALWRDGNMEPRNEGSSNKSSEDSAVRDLDRIIDELGEDVPTEVHFYAPENTDYYNPDFSVHARYTSPFIFDQDNLDAYNFLKSLGERESRPVTEAPRNLLYGLEFPALAVYLVNFQMPDPRGGFMNFYGNLGAMDAVDRQFDPNGRLADKVGQQFTTLGKLVASMKAARDTGQRGPLGIPITPEHIEKRQGLIEGAAYLQENGGNHTEEDYGDLFLDDEPRQFHRLLKHHRHEAGRHARSFHGATFRGSGHLTHRASLATRASLPPMPVTAMSVGAQLAAIESAVAVMGV